MRGVLLAALACAALCAQAQTCQVCGEIKSIRETSASGRPPASAGTGTGALPGTQSDLHPGPMVGTVAQFRFDRGRSEGWSFGAAGTPEMNAHLGQITYEITLAMDTGERRTLQRPDGNRFHVGQRVALREGALEPM